MSMVENRSRRTLFLLVLCLVCWRCVEFSPAFAQERSRPSTPASVPVETSSQRLLPLPAGASADLKQQVQWLQQLRGLLAAGELGGDTSAIPKFDPEQLNALLNAMKQLSGAVPLGTVLPKPSESPSSEQILKMMSNPAVQEQVRQLLKQFSQDGKMLPRKETGDSKSAPISSDSPASSPGGVPDISSMPPAAQELMKRLLQQAGRQPKQPLNDPKSGDQKLKPANPDRERVEPVITAPDDKPKPSGNSPTDAERSVSRPGESDFRDDKPITSVERARSALEAMLREPRKGLNLPTQPSEATRKPIGPSTLGLENEKVDTGSRITMPSRLPPSNPSRVSPAAPPSSKPAVTPANPNDSPKSPQMDVRSELQQNGFAQTLRKLIDQTHEESRVESNGSAGGQDAGKGSLSGLEKSITRLIDRFRKDTAREAAHVPSATPMPVTPVTPQPSTPPPDPERRSTAGKVFESVGKVFNEMVAAPNVQSRNARPGRTSRGSLDSPGVTSRSTGPLLMLLAVLGLVWYFLPRVVTAVKESQLLRRSNFAGEVTSSADIRTREDVVRAFHHYALQSAMSVPTWWTHREVERQVADVTPALKPSIQVLADLYELARYLPGEAELTPDQIGIARRELDIVSKTNHLG